MIEANAAGVIAVVTDHHPVRNRSVRSLPYDPVLTAHTTIDHDLRIPLARRASGFDARRHGVTAAQSQAEPTIVHGPPAATEDGSLVPTGVTAVASNVCTTVPLIPSRTST